MRLNKIFPARAIVQCAALVVTAGLSMSASAVLVIDYQGLDKEKARHALARQKVAPEGYKVLSDKSRGVVQELGRGRSTEISSFGDDLPLSDGLSMIMPEGWVAFVDEDLSLPEAISWDARGVSWTKALGDLGTNSGLRFIVDWDQNVVQVFGEKGYKQPELTDAVEVVDPKTGKTFLIFPDGDGRTAGKLVHKDKSYPIKIVK